MLVSLLEPKCRWWTPSPGPARAPRESWRKDRREEREEGGVMGTEATFETREGSLQLWKTHGYFVEERQGENMDLLGAL